MSAHAVATSAERAGTPSVPGASRFGQIRSLTRRNLIHIKRQPESLTDVTIQPIMFVLLFAYVFGGAITTAGADYKEWMVPGIMAQTMTFSSFVVAMGLNDDIGKGIIDRFRSLPIQRSSVLISRSISSLIHSSLGVVVMSLTGLIVGWRLHLGIGRSLLGFALLLLFGFAMIWVGILIGSAMKSIEAVQGVMFTTMFPITFLANTFAPTERMEPWLRVIAEWNPISSLSQAIRELWGNTTPVDAAAALPLHHPVISTVVWSCLITAVIAPLALRAFNRRTSA